MKTEKFTSRIGMVLAAAAGAVGLGNIWKFPYVLGENGGGVFLLIYILCVILFGLPLMMTEFMIGKRSGSSIHTAYQRLAGNRYWNWMPVLTFLSTMAITGVYLVITGWCLGYLFMSLSGAITQVSETTSDTIFHSMVSRTDLVCLFATLATVLTASISWTGVGKGIERLCKILMPLLLVLLLILVVRVCCLPGAGAGFAFLFSPDWSCLKPSVVLDAMGQSFYSLSIGMGALITYGAYMPKDQNVALCSSQIAAIDTLVAVLAGCAIFPAVFAFGLCPVQGPKLVFEMVPLVFNHMIGGQWLSIIFFVLLTIAAITSSVSLVEVLVASLMDSTSRAKHPIHRHWALVISCGLCLAVSVGCVLSGAMFDWTDTITSNYTLPLIALGTVVYFGWFVDRQVVEKEMCPKPEWRKVVIPVYLFLIRWFIPIMIVLIFLKNLGVI